MPYTSLDGRLGKLIARGGNLSADVAERVVAGDVQLSSAESDQLTITLVDDADLNVLGSNLFEAGTPTARGSRLDFARLRFEVRSVEITPRGTDHALTVTARSLGTCRLKRDRGAHVWRNVSPTQIARKLATDAGLEFVGQGTGKRKSIARKGAEAGELGESSWDVIVRLAGEAGFITYESAGVLYFAKPTWLVEELDAFPLRWRGTGTGGTVDALPTCRRVGDDPKRLATVTARLRGDAAEDLNPGQALELSGVSSFDGRYLIDSITVPLLENAAVEVTALTPINPDKVERFSSAGSSSSSDESTTGAKSAAAFVAVALKQAGDSYLYGAEASADTADPNAFDCSELVQWAAARVGVTFVDGSSAQIAACEAISVEEGLATRGALLWHEGHIAISTGDGRTIEAANSRVGVVRSSAAGRFTRAGLIPGMRY
jgi:cell wall-associated NlpC family hydrolase